MKRLATAFSVLFVLAAVPASADNPVVAHLGIEAGGSMDDLTPTPEMWFYQQYQQQYEDPRMAVRRKAEFRAVQRQRRIAALKWFGFSNSRPVASSDPIHGDYAPHWASNNGFYRSQWNGVGRSWVIVSPYGPGIRTY